MSRRTWLIVAVVVVVFAAGITVGVVVFGNDKSAGAVTLEPVASTGTDPFTSSVAVRPVAISGPVQAITAATRKTLSANPRSKASCASSIRLWRIAFWTITLTAACGPTSRGAS